MTFSKELIEKAKVCQTAEELIALAKENEIELSVEEAELYLQDFEEGELTDEELDNVAGGQEGCAKPSRPYENVYWDKKEDVQFLFKEGDIVQAFADFCKHHTATCKVVSIEAHPYFDDPCGSDSGAFIGWADRYWLEKVKGTKAPFIKSWNQRHNIEQ